MSRFKILSSDLKVVWKSEGKVKDMQTTQEADGMEESYAAAMQHTRIAAERNLTVHAHYRTRCLSLWTWAA